MDEGGIGCGIKWFGGEREVEKRWTLGGMEVLGRVVTAD